MPVRTRSRASRGGGSGTKKITTKNSRSSKKKKKKKEEEEEEETEYDRPPELERKWTHTVMGELRSDDVVESRIHSVDMDLDDVLEVSRKTRNAKKTTGKRKSARSRSSSTRRKAAKRSTSSSNRKNTPKRKSTSPAPKKRATRSSRRLRAVKKSKSPTPKKNIKGSSTRSSSRSKSAAKKKVTSSTRKRATRSSSKSKNAKRTKRTTSKSRVRRSISKKSPSKPRSAAKSKSPAKSDPKKKLTRSAMRSSSSGRRASGTKTKKTKRVVIAESKNSYDDDDDDDKDEMYDRPPLLERTWTHTLMGHTRSQDVRGNRLVRTPTVLDAITNRHGSDSDSDSEEPQSRIVSRKADFVSRLEETFVTVTTRTGEKMADVFMHVGEKIASFELRDTASRIQNFIRLHAESDVGPYYVQRFFRCEALDGFFLNGQSFLGGDIQYMLMLPFIVWVIDPAHMQNIALAVIQRYFLATWLGNAMKDLCRLRRCRRGRIQRLTNEFDDEYGFPSTHVAAALAVFLPLILITHFKAKRRFYYDGDTTDKALVILLGTRFRATMLWLLYVFLIAFSRLYLGLNSLMDVAGGVVLGFATMLISNKLTSSLETAAFSVTKVFWKKNIIFALSLSAIVVFMVLIYPDRRVNSTCYRDVLGLAGIMVGGLVQMAIMDFFHVAFKNGKYMKREGHLFSVLALIMGTAMLLLVRKSVSTLFRSVGARRLEISPKLLYALEFAVLGAFVVFSPLLLDLILAE